MRTLIPRGGDEGPAAEHLGRRGKSTATTNRAGSRINSVAFATRQRNDDVMAEHLNRVSAPDDVVFVGRAEEKTPAYRAEKRGNPTAGQAHLYLVARQQ